MRYFIALLFFIYCLPLNAEERILSYNIDIKIETSGDLLITEQIKVRAEGNNIRRGIFRTFPTKYWDKVGNRYKVDFEVLEVMRDNDNEPYFTENLSNGVKLYIGSENVFLDPGIYTYTLKFRTNRQIGFFDEFDELYYNAIGGDWIFDIDNAVVTIHLPDKAKILQSAAYSGPVGSTGCDCSIEPGSGIITYKATRTLYPGDWFTVAVGWPKGVVEEPSTIEKTSNFLKDNGNIFIGIIGLLITFWYYMRAWLKVGRDPGKGAIIPRFEPPEGFTPASTRYVMKMAYSQKCFIASIVNMAVKGYLKIVNERKGDYRLEKLKNDNSDLSAGERALAGALFKFSDTIELDNKNHKKFLKAKALLGYALKKEFQKGLFNVNFKYSLRGILLAIVFGYLVIKFTSSGAIVSGIIIACFIVMILVFAYLLKAPTLHGRKIMDEIEGFQMYLDVAEKGRLEAFHEPDMTVELFEKYLPYAIALGVENGWSKKFEQQISKSIQEEYQPGWYHGYTPGYIHIGGITNTLSNSFSSAISSASTPPGSSSGGSGSGGGGFSGGGGGGGGGGGW
jgi:uncharacterized membrane protein YgcG